MLVAEAIALLLLPKGGVDCGDQDLRLLPALRDGATIKRFFSRGVLAVVDR